jgi:DNA-binding transcriptional LysR family regulator
MCAVRKGHPKVGKTLDLDTYLDLHHVHCAPGKKGPAGLVDELLAERGLTRKIAMQVPHFLGGPFITAQSDLCLTAPRALLVHTAKILPLQIFELPFEVPRSRVFMVWHERVTDDPGSQWLRELTARCTAEVCSL